LLTRMNSPAEGTTVLRFTSEKSLGRRLVSPSLKEIVGFCWASALTP
jgi:hypothetical protein